MVTGKETFQEYFGTWLTEDFWCKIVAKCFFKRYEMYEMKINFEVEKFLRPKTRKRLFLKLHILKVWKLIWSFERQFGSFLFEYFFR